MHEYLHENLENIKKTRNNFTCRPTPNMRSLSIVRPPGREVREVLPPALPVPEIIEGSQKIWTVPAYAHAPFSPNF